MDESRRTIRWAVSSLAVAAALALAGPVAGPATAQSDEGAPTIASVAITSDPGSDYRYAIGDTIEVLVTFSEGVYVEGSPQLELDIGGVTKNAGRVVGLVESSPTGAIAFAYTVQEGDSESDGVVVSANFVHLNGATIRDGDGNDAVLTHGAVASEHKVDGIVPTITSLAITSDPGDDETYGAGDVIEVTLTFDEQVRVHNPLRIALDIGGEFRSATYDELPAGGSASAVAFSYTTTVELSYTVVIGDTDTDGVSIPANVLPQGRGHIRDIAGNMADLSHDALADDPNHMVNAPGGL